VGTDDCAGEARTVDRVIAEIADCAVGSSVANSTAVADVSREAHGTQRAVGTVRALQTLIADGEARAAREGLSGNHKEANSADVAVNARITAQTRGAL
jgi:hypothetical protein